MSWRFWNRGHRRYQDLLSEYVDNRLDADAQARFEEHLAACAECSQELESLRATVGLLQSVPQVEVPRSFRLTTDMVQPERPAPRPILMRSLQLSTAIAVMLVVSLVATDLSGGFDDGVQVPTAAIQEESLKDTSLAIESQEEALPQEFEAGLAATEGETLEMAAEAPAAESAEPEIAGAEEEEAPSMEMAVEEDFVEAESLEVESLMEEEALETDVSTDAEPLIESLDQAEGQEERQVSQPAELPGEAQAGEEGGSGVVRKIEIAAAALAGVLAIATLYLTLQRRRTAR